MITQAATQLKKPKIMQGMTSSNGLLKPSSMIPSPKAPLINNLVKDPFDQMDAYEEAFLDKMHNPFKN